MARSVKGKGGKQKATKRQSNEKISKKELEMIKAFEEERGTLNLEEMLRKNRGETEESDEPEEKEKEMEIEEKAAEDEDENEDEAEEENDENNEEEEEEETSEQLKKDLEELKKTDPELYEYLQKHDPGALDYNEDDIDVGEKEEKEGEEEDAENDMMGAGLNLRSAGQREGADKSKVVTNEMLDELEEQVYTSPKAVRKYLIIYRSACHINDSAEEDGEDGGDDEDSNDRKMGKKVGKNKQNNGGSDMKKKSKNKKKKMNRKAIQLNNIYKIPNSAIFDRIMTFCMSKMRSVFETLLSLASSSSSSTSDKKNKKKQQQQETIKKKTKTTAKNVIGKGCEKGGEEEKEEEDKVEAYVSNSKLVEELEKKSRAWATKVSSYAKSFLVNSVYFVEQLTGEEMKGSALRMLEAYVPFMLSFPVLLRKYFGLTVKLWTSGGEATRLLAFSNIHEIAVLSRGRPFLDAVLRATYLAYVRNSQFVAAPTLPLLQFMRNCLAELFGVDEAAAYRTAFTYVRQLAIHLRGVVVRTEKDALKAIHNWQFLNALRAWCDILAAHAARSESLRQLVYPVLQLLAGVVDYSQGARNVAVRFHCIRMALDLAEAAGCVVNTAVPALLQCLDVADMKKRPKPSQARKIDLNTTLHVGKQYLGTAQIQEFIADNVHELLFRFLAANSCSVAFPELALPALVFLRRFKKVCQQPTLSRKIAGLLDKTQETIEWLSAIRSGSSNAAAVVDFAPRDSKKALAFFAELKAKNASPLAQAWLRFAQQRDSLDKLQHKKDVEEAKRAEKRKREEEEDDNDEENKEDDDDVDDFENMKEEEYNNDEDVDYDDDDEEEVVEEKEDKEKEKEKKKKKEKGKKAAVPKKTKKQQPPKKKKSKKN